MQSAASIANAVASNKPLIVGPVDKDLLLGAGITLPEKAEFRSGNTRILPWIEQVAEKNSLVIGVSRGWALERIMAELSHRGCSVAAILEG